MKGFRILMRKLCSGLILLALVDFSVCFENRETQKFKENIKFKGSTSLLGPEVANIDQIRDVCESCGCSSYKDSVIESFKSYTCIDCNSTKLQEGDCIFEGVIRESNKENKTQLVGGLSTSTYGDYKMLFVGKSDILINRKDSNNLLARIFEPEFTWERFSYGSIKDNCVIYRDGEKDFDHFKLRYTYTLHGDKNCTEFLIHFVDKHSGSTLYKSLRPFKGMNENYDFNSMIVFRHDDIKVSVDSFEKINLHQEFNITFYNLPPKYLFSNVKQEWVPTGMQIPQIEIHPKIVHDRLLLLFQLINSQKSSIPNCKFENIKVNVMVQCRGVAFQPNPKYSKKLIENQLRDIHSRYNSKEFNLFLRKFEEKLKHVLESIPNAMLAPNHHGPKLNTPLSSLSIPCKEALYLNDIPRLMSAFNYTSILSERVKPNSYMTSMHILEDAEEDTLLKSIESVLNAK